MPTANTSDKNQTASASKSAEENIRTLGEMIKGIRVAMLTTLDPDGVLRSRPMATQELEFDGRLWFFTGNHSGKVSSINNDQHVNVSYASIDDNRYVSIAGRARVVQDREKAKELWSPALKAWFPEGLEDPELGLICVEVEGAEYWDSASSKFVHLVGFAKAMITGRRYDDAGENEKLEIRPSDSTTH